MLVLIFASKNLFVLHFVNAVLNGVVDLKF